MNKLEEICATKREEVAERQAQSEVSELIARIAAQAPPRGFEAALRRTHHKVLAKIHPDRHTGSALHVRVQAEELFKLLGEAYERERARLTAVSGGGGQARGSSDLSA